MCLDEKTCKPSNNQRKRDPADSGERSAQTKKAYSVSEFCQYVSVSRATAYREMRAGRLKYRKLGRKRLIGKEDADHWFEKLRSPDDDPPAGAMALAA